ncbi:MAG: hypothetical protein GX130_06195 [Candidatus Hydrogenedens sp.]|jgi:uncharacterized protein YprB with RNaseH-like and TPR domain|nr:hypothetical protein [Candidatus Hydrogenedens sp.]
MSENKDKLKQLKNALGLKSGADISPGKKPVRKKRAVSRSKRGGKSTAASDGGQAVPLAGSELSRRLYRHLGLENSVPDSRPVDETAEAVPLESLLDGEVIENEEGAFYLWKRSFPLTHHVGRIPLMEGLRCGGREIALSALDEDLASFDPARACFLDAETTGLAGGAGTVAFLIGIGYYSENAFILEQCFMRDYDDEAAMLLYLSEKLGSFETLVSYNGKSFDAPLLRSRFVQSRMAFPLDAIPHYDLVHAVRRLWKRRLKDCSLTNIEESVLHFFRENDVPGYLIPQLWFDYLEEGDGRPLEGVFMHHAWDILSLAALAGHLASCIAEKEGTAFFHGEDQVSLIRLYFRNKEFDRVVEQGEKFLAASLVSDLLRLDCLKLVGKAYKKLGNFEAMRQTWEILHEEYPQDPEGAEHLSKFYEHQLRNPFMARDICRRTLDCLAARVDLDRELSDFSRSSLQGRLRRLEKKLEKYRAKYGQADLLDHDDEASQE